MVQISIQHIIGTVALIGVVVSAGLFYNIFTSFVQDDNRQKELGQISENVAMNIAEMINIVKFETFSSNYGNYTVKIIDLPTEVGGQPYKIQLVNVSGQMQVHSFLSNRESISANSTIPFNSGGSSIVLNTTSAVYNIKTGIDLVKIACSGIVYGKNGTAIWAHPVWERETGNSPSTVTVGIGWVEAQQ
jgi:hypothetical protein